MAIDHRLIKALHVETLRRQDLHAEREPHVLFQASTFESLLESNYDGEVSFAELRDHGDLGLGTFDAVDGEMIAVDGEFFRAAFDGTVHRVEPSRKTPFAVVTFFQPHTASSSPTGSTTRSSSPRSTRSWEIPRSRTHCASTGASIGFMPARSRASASPTHR